MIDVDSIYKTTVEKYNKAKKSMMLIEKRAFNEKFSALSDVVPGYSEDAINFESYEKDKFGVLFIDMRNSTKRAELIGPEKTFLTMHAFIPAMLEVVKVYKGNVIDIMGDGIMVFFGGNRSELTHDYAVKNSGLCGRDMLLVCNNVVNKILVNDGIEYKITCGVGIDYGSVIVTKIGINDFYDVKAFGDCINKASKFSRESNVVKVSKYVKQHWPTGKNGKISFSGSDNEGYILIDNN